ncbi:unnamed protein product [Arabis nemorensis]|uniref:Uncharacterized protein n=1 Tax=Arabis nemorensis TaxID=586526 RepID=A0A565ATR0_9BRAS|nr:unnamed protein product [Arabis nemorensis]
MSQCLNPCWCSTITREVSRKRLGFDAIKEKFGMTCEIKDSFDQNRNPCAKMVYTSVVEIKDKDGNPTTVDVDHVIHTSICSKVKVDHKIWTLIRSDKCILTITIGTNDTTVAQVDYSVLPTEE